MQTIALEKENAQVYVVSAFLQGRNEMKDRLRQIATFIGIVAGILINTFASRGDTPSNADVGQISDQTNTLITPTGATFAIWGLIFGWTLVYAIYQALPGQRDNPLHRRIGWWAALNGIGGGLWTLAFTSRQFILAWALIVVLLVALLVVSVRTGLGRNAPHGRDYWLVYAPFNINFAWISIATILNTTQVLQYVIGWDGAPLSAQTWGALLIVIAAALGVWQVVGLRNIPFGLVVVWALAGVAAANAGIAPVLIAAVTAIVLVVIALGVTLLRRSASTGGRRSSAA